MNNCVEYFTEVWTRRKENDNIAYLTKSTKDDFTLVANLKSTNDGSMYDEHNSVEEYILRGETRAIDQNQRN